MADAATGEQSVDQQELVRLYLDLQPGLVGLATVLVRDREVALEIVQESFLRVHGRLASIDEPAAYLRTTVINLCRSHGRRQRTISRQPRSTPASSPPPRLPSDMSAVWSALEVLPQRQRDAIVLRYYMDLPDGEIADLLGARPGTIRSLISRGIARLRVEMSA